VITVRYSTGLAVTYNDARYTVTTDRGVWLYDQADENARKLIAIIQASAGAAIEHRRACRAEVEGMTVEKAARHLAEHPGELEQLPPHVARDLKRALNAFDARKGVWR
jgi:hypothetical protein